MEALVMGDTPMAKAPDMVEFGMMGPFNRINSDRYGLGYTVYYYQKFVAAQDRNVRVCALNGVAPNAQTIASKEYPLTCDVYAVIRKDLAAVPNNGYGGLIAGGFN